MDFSVLKLGSSERLVWTFTKIQKSAAALTEISLCAGWKTDCVSEVIYQTRDERHCKTICRISCKSTVWIDSPQYVSITGGVTVQYGRGCKKLKSHSFVHEGYLKNL